MADNITVLDSLGATQTIATRDVGGVHYQNISPPVSTSHLVTAGSTNATVVKASAGILRSVYIFNNAGYPVYAKFHNSASAPTAGTGVVFAVPSQAGLPTAFVLPGGGRSFSSGIAMTVVKDIADAGATAVLASDALIEVAYD